MAVAAAVDFRRILVVVDDPASCSRLFAWTERVAEALGSQVWVLLGVDSPDGSPPALESAERTLDLALERAGLDRLGARPLVHAGPVAGHLSAALADLIPDVVVMSCQRPSSAPTPLQLPGMSQIAVILVSDGSGEGQALP
ncbi:MAG: universal stress protein [Gemmatimonadota bacterium]